MRHARTFLFALTLLLVTGCAAINYSAKADRLRKGMTPRQVVNIFGHSPERCNDYRAGRRQQCVWGGTSRLTSTVYVYFESGTVTDWQVMR